MKIKEYIEWAKDLESKKTHELVALGVHEHKVEKAKGTLKAFRERLDIIQKEVVKHDRFLNENDQALAQLDKWGVPISLEDKKKLKDAGLLYVPPTAPMPPPPSKPQEKVVPMPPLPDKPEKKAVLDK